MKSLGVNVLRMSAFRAYYENVYGLNSFVRQHLTSVEWLVSTRQEVRGTGRTTALALAYLKDSFSSRWQADSFSGVGRVLVQDHRATRYGHYCAAKENLIRKISNMGVDISSDGEIASQLPVQSGLEHQQVGYDVKEIMKDFQSLCAAAFKMGVSPVWMLDQVRSMIDVKEIMGDFQSLCVAAFKRGVSPVWMLDQVRSMIASSVMFT